MKYLLSFLAILTLATMACGFTVNIPSVPTSGPEVTDEISVAVSKSEETRLKISFGVGELTLSPGADDLLVEGRRAVRAGVEDQGDVVARHAGRDQRQPDPVPAELW